MKLFEELTDENFQMFAIRNYYNPTCIDAEEFYEDLKRFKYVKRLTNRYQTGGKLSVNLMLNHIVVIINVFGIDASLKMLDFKFTKEQMSVIKPFLIYLKAIDNTQYTGIHMDEIVVNELRKI